MDLDQTPGSRGGLQTQFLQSLLTPHHPTVVQLKSRENVPARKEGEFRSFKHSSQLSKRRTDSPEAVGTFFPGREAEIGAVLFDKDPVNAIATELTPGIPEESAM